MLKGCQDGTPPDPQFVADQMAQLEKVVDEFAAQMKAKLAVKVGEGRSGWDDPANREQIWTSMLAHGAAPSHAAGQEVDVANFAMFLWFIRTREIRP